MLFFDPYIVWQRETSFRLIQKKSRNSSPIGTHWDDHPLLSLSSNSWDGLSRKSRGFSASFWRPNQGPLRSELRSSLKDILESIFVNKNTFEIHIYYHLFSFIFIYSHLLFASVLCDNIPLGSFVVLFGILDCQSGFSFVPLDAA